MRKHDFTCFKCNSNRFLIYPKSSDKDFDEIFTIMDFTEDSHDIEVYQIA
jgi:hypothetical protein